MPKPPPQLKARYAKARHKSVGISRRPLSINELVTGGKLLNELHAQKARELGWREWLVERLPADLAPHLAGASLRGEQLVVTADAAAWGSRLRYALQPLMDEITRRDPAIRRLAFRTRAPAGPRKP